MEFQSVCLLNDTVEYLIVICTIKKCNLGFCIWLIYSIEYSMNIDITDFAAVLAYIYFTGYTGNANTKIVLEIIS